MASVKRIDPGNIQTTFSSSTIDLISASLGSQVVSQSDEWFACASNLLTPGGPIRKPGYFVHTGAWYDGWETRRHNPNEYDWVVIRLGVVSGKVRGVEIDTTHFDGNHAPEIEVQGTIAIDNETIRNEAYSDWQTILNRQECGPNQQNAWDLGRLTDKAYTHIRLLMFPDGGIARFRLYGQAVPVLPEHGGAFDLAAIKVGGRAISCSDQHFGSKDNLLLPNRGKNMGEGWETKRSRGTHIDWVIIRLGAAGMIEQIIIDTAHFRGNFPKEVQVFAAFIAERDKDPEAAEHSAWTEILKPQKAIADTEHVYNDTKLCNSHGQKYSHIKLVIIPDGGVSRIRVIGKASFELSKLSSMTKSYLV